LQSNKAFFVAGRILETSNIQAASDIADLDLNNNLSLGGPAQSTLPDALRHCNAMAAIMTSATATGPTELIES
jgi:hypothetical protein